jgi:carboxylesterase type B
MIFGQSSGANDIQSLLASPAARGLFSLAGIESGGYLLGQTSKLADVEKTDSQLVALVGCAQAVDVLACLMAVPADVLTTAANQSGLVLTRVLEPRVIPADPFAVLQRDGTPCASPKLRAHLKSIRYEEVVQHATDPFHGRRGR